MVILCTKDRWMFLVCLRTEPLWGIDHDISTALLVVFISRRGQLFTCCHVYHVGLLLLVISILIILTSRHFSFTGSLCFEQDQWTRLGWLFRVVIFRGNGIHAHLNSYMLEFIFLKAFSINFHWGTGNKWRQF